jgi:excisionase family DNA binding protein
MDDNKQGHQTATVTLPLDAWADWRKAVGFLIDPQTAEVDWGYGQTLDPYNVLDLPDECKQVGHEYFARAPGTKVWVSFRDLPEKTREALWRRDKDCLKIPGGLRSPGEIEQIASGVNAPDACMEKLATAPYALTIAEACSLARVGRTATYNAIRTGELRAIKRGRRTLVLPGDLARWIGDMPAREVD